MTFAGRVTRLAAQGRLHYISVVMLIGSGSLIGSGQFSYDHYQDSRWAR